MREFKKAKIANALIGGLLICNSGCKDPKGISDLVASPASGPLSGYYEVTLDFSAVGQEPTSVTGVFFEDIRAYGLSATPNTLTVTVQGAPKAGPAEIRILTEETERVYPEAFEYEVFPHELGVFSRRVQELQEKILEQVRD